MVRFDEKTKCHFFPEKECMYPISEDELKEALKEAQEEEVIGQIPEIDSNFCTNCLLAQILARE